MVLPIHDKNPTRRRPIVNWLLIAINVVAFLISPVATAPLLGETTAASVCAQDAFFDRYAAKPVEVLSEQPLADSPRLDLGEGRSFDCPARTPYAKQPFLSVLSAMFLHGGWAHLLGNLLFLLIFGNNIEDRLGRLKYLGFYLFCGYAATYGHSLLTPDSAVPLVGASGAIAGVLGAYLVLYPRARVWSLLTFFFFLPVRLPAWVVLGSWFVLQYLYFRGAGLSDNAGVAYGAHVIGFVVGALLVFRLRGTGQPRELAPPRWGPHARR